MNKIFRSIFVSKKSKARLGTIHTAHGIINTPAFVPVGTKGTIKALLPSLIPELKIQVAFVNTYHLVTHPGSDIIEKAGGIHHFSQLNIPLMSDSGGFQVFSLAKTNQARSHVFESASPLRGPRRLIQKQVSSPHNISAKRKAVLRGDDSLGILATQHRGEDLPLVEKISDDGVKFRSTYDGQLIEFTPESSMEYQRKIGADLNMAFDECTYYPATHEYAEKAMKRTHEWLERCVRYKNKNVRRDVFCPPHPEGAQAIDKKITSSHFNNKSTNNQFLYGIIQGGTYEDLRKKSAEFVVSQNVDGVAIGGVSVGETKEEMRDQVRWVAPYLPKDKPVHLLGVGQIDDIIDLVKYGIDTFDCVEPTRLARMGILYQSKQILPRVSLPSVLAPLRAVGIPSSRATCFDDQLDITKALFKNDLSAVDIDCNCYVCKHFTKAYLHHLFKQREILGYNLATYHNLWMMEKLMEGIREMIMHDFL